MTRLPPNNVEGHTHSRVASRGGFEHLPLWPEWSDVLCNTPYRNLLGVFSWQDFYTLASLIAHLSLETRSVDYGAASKLCR